MLNNKLAVQFANVDDVEDYGVNNFRAQCLGLSINV